MSEEIVDVMGVYFGSTALNAAFHRWVDTIWILDRFDCFN